MCAWKGIIVAHLVLDVIANRAITSQMVPIFFPRFCVLPLPELWTCAACFETAASKHFNIFSLVSDLWEILNFINY